ncbi:MAG: hypothetical protein H6Q10_3719, partial [Acidobacteria bacterium]|nr:hypothetical protein [Acidobacteriota bacterium]
MNVLSRWLIVPSIAVAAIAVAALSGCGSS